MNWQFFIRPFFFFAQKSKEDKHFSVLWTHFRCIFGHSIMVLIKFCVQFFLLCKTITTCFCFIRTFSIRHFFFPQIFADFCLFGRCYHSVMLAMNHCVSFVSQASVSQNATCTDTLSCPKGILGAFATLLFFTSVHSDVLQTAHLNVQFVVAPAKRAIGETFFILKSNAWVLCFMLLQMNFSIQNTSLIIQVVKICLNCNLKVTLHGLTPRDILQTLKNVNHSISVLWNGLKCFLFHSRHMQGVLKHALAL